MNGCHSDAEKARKQYEKFNRLYKNGLVSDYKYYEVAEATKTSYRNLSDMVRDISLPEKLPTHLRDTMNMAISNISESYGITSSAYEVVMDILDNGGNLSDIKDFKEKMQLAHELYEQGILLFYIAANDMNASIAQHKQKSKNRSK